MSLEKKDKRKLPTLKMILQLVCCRDIQIIKKNATIYIYIHIHIEYTFCEAKYVLLNSEYRGLVA